MINIELIDNIKKIIDSLDKTTSWGLVMLFATLTTALYTKKTITILGATVPKNISGIATFGILCCINFKIFHLLQNLKSSLMLLESDREVAYMRIRLHTWTMNPFSETEGKFSLISDNFGYTLLILLWWLGAQTGFYLIQYEIADTKLIIIFIFFYFVYLSLGIISMILISELISIICSNDLYKKIKLVLTLIGIPFGLALTFLLF